MAGQRRRFLMTCSVALVASAALVRALVLPIAIAPPSTPTTATTPAATQAMKDAPRIEAADPKELKTLLPAAVGALKQGDAEAGTRSLGEMHSTFAQATYAGAAETDAGAGKATVKIVDYIAMPGLIESVAPWQSLDIDNETDAEYSRTVAVGANKAMETYVKQTRTGSINVLVANRFVVSVEVSAMPAATLRTTANALKLDDLAKLAK